MPAPDGPQFVRVYHASLNVVPPHRRKVKHGPDYDFGRGNTHPDIVHAGTLEAARGILGANTEAEYPYIHAYDIPVHKQYPVVFGDDFGSTFHPEEEVYADEYPSVGEFVNKMRGVQPGLFESVSGTPDIALKTSQAVPYRQRGEDIGSISWMIPKSAFHRGGVRHVGVMEAKRLSGKFRDKGKNE